MKGSTYKRCRCRGEDGRELGSKCPKLRRKDQSWNPRHGTWYFRLELDAGPGGKRRTIRRGGYASQDDALDALDEAKAKSARGVDPAARVTVGQYLDGWLAGSRGLSRSTRRRYEGHIRNYFKPHLGHIDLDQLRVAHLTEMFEAIEAANTEIEAAAAERRRLRAAARDAHRAGDHAAHQRALDALAQLPPPRRPVGASTRQQIRATLRSALSDAVREGLITTNPAKLVRLPAGKRPKALVWTPGRVQEWHDAYAHALAAAGEPAGSTSTAAFKVWKGLPRPSKVMVWTPEQTGRFLDHAAEHRLYALFHLMAFTGIRRGEACGLEWTDVDLGAREIRISTQRVAVTYSDVEDTAPKTDASDDTVPLDTATADLLRAHRARQKEDQMAWGREAWVRSGKVFTMENGAPLHPDHVAHRFLRIGFEAGLPPIRLHDLRHGAATLMLAGGADMKMVQAMLRHSSMALTSDTYTSVLPDVAREAAEAAVALVPRAAPVGVGGTVGLPSGSPRRLPRGQADLPDTSPQVTRPADRDAEEPEGEERVISSTAENVPDQDAP